jgi:hypothetical protein
MVSSYDRRIQHLESKLSILSNRIDAMQEDLDKVTKKEKILNDIERSIQRAANIMLMDGLPSSTLVYPMYYSDNSSLCDVEIQSLNIYKGPPEDRLSTVRSLGEYAAG